MRKDKTKKSSTNNQFIQKDSKNGHLGQTAYNSNNNGYQKNNHSYQKHHELQLQQHQHQQQQTIYPLDYNTMPQLDSYHFHLQNQMGHQINPINHMPNYNYQHVQNIQNMTQMHRNMGYMPHINPIYQGNMNGFQGNQGINVQNRQNMPNMKIVQNPQNQQNYHSFEENFFMEDNNNDQNYEFESQHLYNDNNAIPIPKVEIKNRGKDNPNLKTKDKNDQQVNLHENISYMKRRPQANEEVEKSQKNLNNEDNNINLQNAIKNPEHLSKDVNKDSLNIELKDLSQIVQLQEMDVEAEVGAVVAAERQKQEWSGYKLIEQENQFAIHQPEIMNASENFHLHDHRQQSQNQKQEVEKVKIENSKMQKPHSSNEKNEKSEQSDSKTQKKVKISKEKGSQKIKKGRKSNKTGQNQIFCDHKNEKRYTGGFCWKCYNHYSYLRRREFQRTGTILQPKDFVQLTKQNKIGNRKYRDQSSKPDQNQKSSSKNQNSEGNVDEKNIGNSTLKIKQFQRQNTDIIHCQHKNSYYGAMGLCRNCYLKFNYLRRKQKNKNQDLTLEEFLKNRQSYSHRPINRQKFIIPQDQKVDITNIKVKPSLWVTDPQKYKDKEYSCGHREIKYYARGLCYICYHTVCKKYPQRKRPNNTPKGKNKKCQNNDQSPNNSSSNNINDQSQSSHVKCQEQQQKHHDDREILDGDFENQGQVFFESRNSG